MSDLNIFHRSPGQLVVRHRDYRAHPGTQIERLCASIRDYGFNEPVAIDADDRIGCGAARVAAAIRLGLNRIPVIRLDHLDPGKLRAYAIAANKIAEMAGYDESELALELADIQTLIGDRELPEMGFEATDLDRLLNLDNGAEDDEVIEAPDPCRAISKVGDVWQLARHSLMCGDALERASYLAFMGAERAGHVISDLPYNLSTETFSTTGRHDNFCQGAGEFDSAQFTRFVTTTAMRHMADMSTNGSIHMFFMSYHFLLELLRAGRIVYGDLKTIITWMKPFPTLGSWYRSQSEFIAAFKNGNAPYLNNLGVNGRNRSTVWEYDGMAGFGQDRDELLAVHPTPKPVPLIADAILDCSKRGSIVLIRSPDRARSCWRRSRRAGWKGCATLVRFQWFNISAKVARMEQSFFGRWRQNVGDQLDLRAEPVKMNGLGT